MAEEESDVKAELEEMRKKMADVEEMKKKMAEMERKHREELLEVEQKRKDQGEMLLQMMENVTAANTQLTKVESEMQEMKMAGSSKNNTREERDPNNWPLQLTQMSCFDLAIQNGDVQPDYAWQINNVSQKFNQGAVKFNSPLFTWKNSMVQSQMRIEVNENDVVLMSLAIEGISPHAKLTTIPAVYYVLKDQRSWNSGDEPKHLCRVINYTFPAKLNSSLTFEITLTHKAWLTHPSYNANDAIVVELYVEPAAIAQHVHSFDGTLNWSIDNCHRRKRMAVEELVLYQESPYFYTGQRGYRVKVRMWLDGCGEYKGKGLLAGVYFMTGEFDDALPSIFPHRTTITLTNPREPQRSITKTIDDDLRSSKFYFINMGEFQEIGTVVHNDTIFYRVNIQPFN